MTNSLLGITRPLAALVALVCATEPALAQSLFVHPKADTIVTHPKAHVVLPIVIAGDLAAIQVTTTYASSRLTFDSMTVSNSAWTLTVNGATPGKILWNAFTPTTPGDHATAHELARIWFTVKTGLGATAVTPALTVIGTQLGAQVTADFTTAKIVLLVQK